MQAEDASDEVGTGLRVFQLVTDTDRRGAQVFATDLHRGLTALGCRVSTAALAPGRTGGLDLPVLGPSRRSLTALRNLRREFRAADVVVAHGSTTLFVCAIAGIGLSTGFVYRQISDSMFWASSPAKRLRVRIALRRARRVVALYDGAARTLNGQLGVRPDRVAVVPNAVDATAYAPASAAARASARTELALPPDVVVVAAIGALAREKGFDVAIEGMRDVQGDVCLLVVGDGPERASLESTASTIPGGRVRFTGSIRVMSAVLDAVDVVTLPSRGGDSMPATLIEAGLAALPTVTTPIGGITEIVANGETGLVVAVGSVPEWRSAVETLVADRDLRETLGAAARERCQTLYSIDSVAREWLQLLRSVTR